VDVESTWNKKTGIRNVFQITIKKGYWYGNRVKESTSKDSTNVIDILEGKSNVEEMSKSTKFNSRLIAGQNFAHQNNNVLYQVLDFESAIKKILDMCDGKTLVTYCLENDMGILRSFQDYLNTNGHNINIMDDPKWDNFNKVCARSLIFNHCPNSKKFIHEFEDLNTDLVTKRGNYGTSLENVTRCFRNDPSYDQIHSSAHDTCDLFFVLQCVAKKDGCPLDGSDHLEEVENIRCQVKKTEPKIFKVTTTWDSDNSNVYADELNSLYDEEDKMTAKEFNLRKTELKKKFNVK
jgi:hypothetical protein